MISPAGSGFYISFDQIEYVDSVAVSVFMNSLAKFDHECCMVDPVRSGFRISWKEKDLIKKVLHGTANPARSDFLLEYDFGVCRFGWTRSFETCRATVMWKIWYKRGRWSTCSNYPQFNSSHPQSRCSKTNLQSGSPLWRWALPGARSFPQEQHLWQALWYRREPKHLHG